MASRSLGVLSVDLVAKIGGFTRGMTQAEREAAKSSKAIEARLRKLGKGVEMALKFAGGAAVAAFGALAVSVKQAIDNADDMSKMAQKIGISTEALSTLGYAAKLAGVEMGEFQAGLNRLTKFQNDAAQGTERNIELFTRLGVAYQNADGSLRDAGAVFRDLADRLSAMPDGADKAAIALEAFGRSGANLIPMLNLGNGGIEELEERARRLGLELSDGAGKSAEELNDRLSDLWSVTEGLSLTVAQELLPDIIELTNSLAETIREGGGMVEVGRDIADIFRGLVQVFQAAGLAIEGMGERFNIAAQYKNMLLDPIGWQTYQAEIDASTQRLRGLEEQSKQLALAARQNFGLDPKVTWIDPPPPKRGSRQRGTPMKDGETVVIRPTGGQSDAWGIDAMKAAQKAAGEADRELQRIMDAGRSAAESLTSTVERNAAALAGPAAEAARTYADELMRLTGEEEKLRAAQMLTGQAEAELAIAREQAFESYQKTTKAIEEQRTGPAKEMLADLQFELELLGMTNSEREKAIALRWAQVDAASAEGKAIAAAMDEVTAAQEQIRGQDFFRDEMKGLFTDVVSGAKSAKDAINSFFDSLRMRAIEALAERLMDQLFGQSGTTDGGMAGGGWASFIGGLFGGARAAGGPVQAGKAYLVGEQGPELIRPMGAGMVVPAAQTAAMRGGFSVGGITMVTQGATSKRSIQAQRLELGRELRRAARDFG